MNSRDTSDALALHEHKPIWPTVRAIYESSEYCQQCICRDRLPASVKMSSFLTKLWHFIPAAHLPYYIKHNSQSIVNYEHTGVM